MSNSQVVEVGAGQAVALVVGTDVASRVQDALLRANGAVIRAKAAVGRIKDAQARLESASWPTDAMAQRQKTHGTVLAQHERTLADKQYKNGNDWLTKAKKRAERAKRGDYESFTKVIRYSHLAEKCARLAERQAYWCECYTNFSHNMPR